MVERTKFCRILGGRTEMYKSRSETAPSYIFTNEDRKIDFLNILHVLQSGFSTISSQDIPAKLYTVKK